MRVGIVRSDIGTIFLNDVESRSQRCFSKEPPGQALYLHKPTSAELKAVLDWYAFLSVQGTDNNATVDTSVNDTLKIRQSSGAAWTSITVTSGVATAKTTIRDDLNTAFTANGLDFVASVTGTNQLQIDTTKPNSGPNADMLIDSVAGGSTLSTPLGYNIAGVTLAGLTVAALEAAIRPTSTTIDVSTATITGLSTFALLTTAQKAALVDGIADVVAPKLIETGQVLLSFAYGNLSKMRVATFRPGGVRGGLPAGIGAAIVEDDGTTVFTV